MFLDMVSRRRRMTPKLALSAHLRLVTLEHRLAPAITVTTFEDLVTPEGGPSDDHKVSLREALIKANENPDRDTIVLKAGTYGMKHQTDYGTGEGNRFGIKYPVTIQGAGAGATKIDAQGFDGVFGVGGPTSPGIAPISVTFKGVTILNGKAKEAGGGGGILVSGRVHLEIVGCEIRNNTALGSGGGISSTGDADITLTNSRVHDNRSSGDGGGIALSNGKATLEHSRIFDNRAKRDGGGIYVGFSGSLDLKESSEVETNTSEGSGGGIAIKGGPVKLTHSIVGNNHAEKQGGGIYDAGTSPLTVEVESEVSNNTSSSDGGGIASVNAKGDVHIIDSIVVGNKAKGNGGGLYSSTSDADLFLQDSEVRDNKSNKGGGGIYNQSSNREWSLESTVVLGNKSFGPEGGGGIYSESRLSLSEVIVGKNYSVGPGAGIYAKGLGVIIGRSTLSRNTSHATGGGLALDGAGNSQLTNVTVSGNHAIDGGGIWHGGSGILNVLNVTITRNLGYGSGEGIYNSGGVVIVNNTIVAQNGNEDVAGSFLSGGYNLIGIVGASAGFANGVIGDQVGSILAPIDAMLGPLTASGSTAIHLLRKGSPAIDRANPNFSALTDQRGHPRPPAGDPLKIADIGAVEM